MSPKERLIDAKVSLLQLSVEMKNISKACMQKGRDRQIQFLRDEEGLRAVWASGTGAAAGRAPERQWQISAGARRVELDAEILLNVSEY